MASPPSESLRAEAERLPASTGRSLTQWVDLARREGPTTPRACARWLKRKHALGHYQAQIVAGEACGASVIAAYDHADELVRALYIAREDLLPLHERVIAAARAQGPDVRVSPCRSYVSLYRKNAMPAPEARRPERQFATVRPKRNGLEVRMRGSLEATLVPHDSDLLALRRALAEAYARAT
jgi:hypothetical protein